MDYFQILNLDREPFSTSPDPDFFYHCRQHVQCLQKLELSLRLRRGLNVVVGEVGTGKTTLCRRLIRQLAVDPEMETHLMLDPDFADEEGFLAAVGDMILGPASAQAQGGCRTKERIKNALFEKGVARNAIVVLLIDEGQKLRPAGLECLRELLNYETNTAKLLQIVIFAQTEFDALLKAHANFADRISLDCRLGPLDFADTRKMIRHRLAQSGWQPDGQSLFTFAATWAIHRATGGYPRKIVHLCHRLILALIIRNRRRVDRALVRSCVRRGRVPAVRRGFAYGGLAALALALVLGAGGIDSRRWSEALTGFPRLAARFSPDRRVLERFRVAPALVASETGVPAAMTTPPSSDGAEATVSAATASVSPVPAEAAMTPVAQDLAPAVQAPVAVVPKLLGQAAPGKNETLTWMISGIYGRFNSALLERVVAENPQIEDPSRIPAGQPIRFPAVVAEQVAFDPGRFWVQLEEFDRLEAALDAVRRHAPSAPAVRLMPWWTPGTGIRFSLILRDFFATEEEAAQIIATLPEPASGGRPVMAASNRGAVYFADPWAKP